MISLETPPRPTSPNFLPWLAMLSWPVLMGIGFSATAAQNNTKPAARIPYTAPAPEQTQVKLIGTDSFDSDGNIAEYLWAQAGKPQVQINNPNSDQASFMAPLVKKITKLTFTLTVTDNLGAKSKTKRTITINPVNTPPTADAGEDQTVLMNTPVTLDGTHSRDNDGKIKTWNWKQIAGPKVKLNKPNTSSPKFISPKNPTELKFRLTITDDEKAKATDEVLVITQTQASVYVSANLESKNFSDGEAIASGQTKTLAWTVKNTSTTDLQNVLLTPGTASGGLIIAGLSPSSIALWRKDEIISFTVLVTAPTNIPDGTQSQSWAISYDGGKPVPFNNGLPLGFTLKTESAASCSGATAQAEAIPNFSKISAAGLTLAADSNQWACVQDHNTGLIWEVKSDDNGLHDKDWTYSWFQPGYDSNTNNIGVADAGNCGNNGQECDTQSFVQAVNAQGLCGHTDWRLPNDDELLTLINPNQTEPAINTNFFPLTQPSMYWSSSSTDDGLSAWYVSFGKGYHAWNLKSSARYLRLVRTAN